MELRKDPITRSWVIVGDDVERPAQPGHCPFCPGAQNAPQVIATLNGNELGGGPISAMVHPAPLYRIEGEPHRHAEGIYDAMNTVGAHEVLVQSIRHDIELWQSSDAEISQFLLLTAQRIQDLKGDLLLKIGIHEGPCLAVSLNDRQDYFGRTVNIAARVQGLATSRSIFATRRVVTDLEASKLLQLNGIAVTPEKRSLRGIAKQIEIFEIP